MLLIAGGPDLALNVRQGEVVRLYLTNTANTRVFKVRLPGARLKLVGGDSGRVEREQFIDDVVLAPSERVIHDVLFDQAGQLTLEHKTPDRTYPLAAITVTDDAVEPYLGEQFKILRSDPQLASERRRLASYLHAAPDKALAFVAEMDMGEPDVAPGAALIYSCPMHPTVLSQKPSRCPESGMKLVPAALVHQAAGGEASAAESQHAEPHEHHGDGRAHEAAGGTEWEDDVAEVSKLTTPANMRWILIDRATGAENTAIKWQFKVGDRVRIRLVNEMDSDHPCTIRSTLIPVVPETALALALAWSAPRHRLEQLGHGRTVASRSSP